MTHDSPAPGLRIGLLLAAVALLPGIIALVATGVGGAPTSGLVIAEATGAFSLAALQGLDRRAEGPTGMAFLAALAPGSSFDDWRVAVDRRPTDDDAARLADATARILPLRL